MPYLCGLMQKMLFIFKRDSAKLVPMVSVAGNAGGTTMNLNPEGLGKSIDRTKAPFVVLKPVLATAAKATASSSVPSWGLLARIIFVPLKRKLFAASGCIELAPRSITRNDSFVANILETGTDSPRCCQSVLQFLPTKLPVSMLSLTMQSPASSKLSHGSCVKDGSETSYTSPGTSSMLVTWRPKLESE
ncbi:MAG: hypothetical protein Q9212_000011 [Teloschistes hypoglaucus]